MGSCSTCSLAYRAPGDICGGIPASQDSRLSNHLPWGLLNNSLFFMRCPIISPMCTFYICMSLVMSPAYGASRCMTINFETTWLCCVALPNVPGSLSVILTQPLTGVRQRSTCLSHLPLLANLKHLSFTPACATGLLSRRP